MSPIPGCGSAKADDKGLGLRASMTAEANGAGRPYSSYFSELALARCWAVGS